MKLDKRAVDVALAEKCMSRKDLAQITGMHASSVRRATTGKHSVHPVTVGKIARALGVSVEAIIKDE